MKFPIVISEQKLLQLTRRFPWINNEKKLYFYRVEEENLSIIYKNIYLNIWLLISASKTSDCDVAFFRLHGCRNMVLNRI